MHKPVYSSIINNIIVMTSLTIYFKPSHMHPNGVDRTERTRVRGPGWGLRARRRFPPTWRIHIIQAERRVLGADRPDPATGHRILFSIYISNIL